MTEKRSESIAQLAEALATVQGQIKSASKDKVAKTDKFKYSYATLDSIWDVARKPLSENGLAVVQIPTNSQDGFSLETILVHSSGEWISGIMTLPLVAGRMSELQSMGSAITYARRYMLGAMVGVTTEDDDDGQRAASQSKPLPAKTKVDNRPWQEKSPTKDHFFKRARDTFNLENQDIVDQLKSHGFDGYTPTKALEMWAILKRVPQSMPADNPSQSVNNADADQPALIDPECREDEDEHYSQMFES